MPPNPNSRTFTRRNRRVVIQEKTTKSYSDEVFESFVIQKQGIYYDYMVNNFDSMFNGEQTINHFHIRPGLFGLWADADDLKEEYGKHIQQDCIRWIRNELLEDRLLNLNNWTTIQDPDNYNDMFLGYIKMYQYKQYYLQLALEDSCSECIDCDDCKKNKYAIHFELAYYGWKDAQTNTLHPLNYFVVSSDNMMPEQYWNAK